MRCGGRGSGRLQTKGAARLRGRPPARPRRRRPQAQGPWTAPSSSRPLESRRVGVRPAPGNPGRPQGPAAAWRSPRGSPIPTTGPPALGSSRLSPTSAPHQTPTHPSSPRPLWAPAVPSAQYVLGVSCISTLDLFHSSKRELRLREVELLALGHSASGGPGQDS